MSLVIGNLIMLAASILMVCVGFMKSRKYVLITQIIQISMMGVSCIFFGTIPGVIANIILAVHTLLAYHSKLNKTTKILFSFTAAWFTVMFNNIGFLGIFPLIATILYVAFIDIPDIRKLKLVLAITLIFWVIHDFAMHSYISVVFSSFSIITCMIGAFGKVDYAQN